MTTLLFLCVANSARSQMAEGLARKFGTIFNTVAEATKLEGTIPRCE